MFYIHIPMVFSFYLTTWQILFPRKISSKYHITKLDRDYSKYNFVSKEGKGNCVFETEMMKTDEFLRLQDKMTKYVYNHQLFKKRKLN